MGRRRADSKDRHGRKSEKSQKSKRKSSARHDDSDHSSLFSDPEEFSGDEYDNLGSRKSKKNFKGVDWTSDDDHSDFDSDSDNSHNPTNRKIHNKAHRERSRSRSGLPSNSRYGDSDSDESHSDSDESHSYRFKKEAQGRSGKGGKNRKGYSSRNSDDKNSDNRSHFSARIEHIRREHEDSSFNSDDDSEIDSHSSRSCRDSQKLRGPGSNSNLLEQSQRSLRSLQQSTRSMGQNPALNSSFRGQHQMQTSVPPRNTPPLIRSTSGRSLAGQEQMQTSVQPRNIPPLMRSTSGRSLVGGTGQAFFPGQQYPTSGALLNQSFVNKGQGQGQRIPEIPGRNVEGSISQRFPVGPGNLMRSMSGRSINSYSSGQVLLNRPSQSVNVHSPIQVSPVTMMENSQISQGNNSGAYSGSLGNVLPSPSVYVQQPGVVNMSSNSNIVGGNNGASLSSSLNCQRPGLMTGVSEGNLGINDGLPDTRMLSKQPGMMRLSSQNGVVNINPLINNKFLDSQRPESMRGNLGNSNGLHALSKQSNPIVRMDGTHQPMVQTKNSRNRTSSSVPGDSALVLPGTSESISILSSRRSSVLSSKSRRSAPPETLADQIYSRSRGRGRNEDTHSQGTYDDPPGEDSNRWERKIRDEIYSDDSSYDSFQDNGKGYVDDPPDMFDDDRSYMSGDEPERDKFDESFRSTDDRLSFYDEEGSNVSGFNDDDVGSISESSRSAFRAKKNEKRTRKSASRPSSESDYGKQADRKANGPTYKPERVSYSNNRDFNKKDQDDNITAATKQSSMGWLAQQISIRKSTDANAGARNLEPEGVSNIGRKDFSSKDIKAPDADGICSDRRENDKSIRRDNADSDENSSLSSEADYIMKHKIKDAVLHSVKVGILRSDDSTTTTDTMTREVPSVILSVKDDEQDSFSDSDSLMSIPYDESARGARTACKDEEKRSDSLFRSGRGKNTQEASNKKGHSGASRKAGKRAKETRSRKNIGNDDVSSKVKKRPGRYTLHGKGSKTKNTIEKTKSSRKKKESRSTDSVTRQIGEPQTSSTKRYSLKSNRVENSSQYKNSRRGNSARSSRTSKKDRNNSSNLEHLEIHSFEDRHSVMGLIDQLKSFEFQV